jgi:hypothetical protein
MASQLPRQRAKCQIVIGNDTMLLQSGSSPMTVGVVATMSGHEAQGRLHATTKLGNPLRWECSCQPATRSRLQAQLEDDGAYCGKSVC